MELIEVIKTFFNFPLANFDIWIHIFDSAEDFRNGLIAKEYRHTKGLIYDDDCSLYCMQVKIDNETGTLRFYCSENDEKY